MKDRNEPAFPGMTFEADVSGALCGVRSLAPGMTLRDWYAGQALIGQLMCSDTADKSEQGIASWSYKYADAMLAEREATP